MNPAIVLATYNRVSSFKRLLSSIEQAEYNTPDIPLVISIDGGGKNNAELLAIAENFEWKHGEKRIIQHKENLGLRKHILSCGDLTEEYGAICLFEDDIYVQNHFYSYFCHAVTFYNSDENIAGISIYRYNVNAMLRKPFLPLNSNYDTFFMQYPASWGQGWTQNQWQSFKTWYNKGRKILTEDKIPNDVKNWPESSWLKYFIKYINEQNKYIVYPYTSYSTNFNDAGVHTLESLNDFQSELAFIKTTWNFAPYKASHAIKYDLYFELHPNIFKIHCSILQGKDFEVDLYGRKELRHIKSKYLLSGKVCESPIHEFSLKVKPHELNILNNLQEDDTHFSFAETRHFTNVNIEALDFYYHFPSVRKTYRYLMDKVSHFIKKKLGRTLAVLM